MAEAFKKISIPGLDKPLTIRPNVAPEKYIQFLQSKGITNADSMIQDTYKSFGAQPSIQPTPGTQPTPSGGNDYAQQIDALVKKATTPGTPLKEAEKLMNIAKSLGYKPTEPVEEKDPPNLSDKADIKQILNQILAAGEADTNIDEILTAKDKTETGPFYSKFFDASLPKYDQQTNQAIPPDMTDSIISTLFPGPTQNLRTLDQKLKSLTDYRTSTSGKSITTGEVGLTMPKFPNIYESNEQFRDVSATSKEMLSKYKDNRFKFLESLGIPKEAIEKLKDKKSLEEAVNQDVIDLNSLVKK